MFILQWPKEHNGCPRCSHPYAEVHRVGTENDWSGRCPKCGTQLFGSLSFAVARTERPGKDLLCRITKPFAAVRYHDEAAARRFEVGEKVWYDVDQNNGTVVFNVDNDPWIVAQDILRTSIEISS